MSVPESETAVLGCDREDGVEVGGRQDLPSCARPNPLPPPENQQSNDDHYPEYDTVAGAHELNKCSPSPLTALAVCCTHCASKRRQIEGGCNGAYYKVCAQYHQDGSKSAHRVLPERVTLALHIRPKPGGSV